MSGGSILIYNLGNRDLQWDGQLLVGQEEWKKLTETVRQNRSELDRIRFPQFERTLKFLSEEQGEASLSRIYVVVTDQNPDPEFRKTDTLPLFDLLEQCFERWKGGQPSGVFKEFLGKAALKKLVMKEVNPSDHGRVFKWYMKNLRDIEPDKVWISPVSGTPAMTLGLILASVLRWGSRVHSLYQSPISHPVENPVPRVFHELLLTMRLKDRVEALDMAGAVAVAPEGPLKLLAQAGLARSRFDFEGTKRLLSEALRDLDPPFNGRVSKLREGLYRLQESGNQLERQKGLLVELIFNARLCWRTGRDIDFLGRIYRLHEALLRYLLESLGFPTDDSYPQQNGSRQRYWGRIQELGLASHPVFKQYCGEGDFLRNSLNRRVFMDTIRALLEVRPNGLDLTSVQDFAPLVLDNGVLNWLATKRNSTILGHGFDPVTRKDLEHGIKEYLRNPMGGAGIYSSGGEGGREMSETSAADRAASEHPPDEADPVAEWLKELAKKLDPKAEDPFELHKKVMLEIVKRQIEGGLGA